MIIYWIIHLETSLVAKHKQRGCFWEYAAKEVLLLVFSSTEQSYCFFDIFEFGSVRLGAPLRALEEGVPMTTAIET